MSVTTAPSFGLFGVQRRIIARNKLSMVGLGIIGVLVFLAVFGSLLVPFDPTQVGVAPRLVPPGPPYWMGTDELGRDVLSRVIVGLRISMSVGVAASFGATAIGIVVGALAGFFGGTIIDDLLMRMTEVFMVVPSFFLALVLVALFGANIVNIIVALTLLSWAGTARIVRSEFLSLKSRQFVDAARVAGAGTATLVFAEILPNALGPVIVATSLRVGQLMLVEAGLAYLGLGDPNAVSLGLMLNQAQSLMRISWWSAFFPGMLIFLAVLSFNLVGDALNDIANPRSRSR